MKKTILFLGIILLLIATPLFSQDKGAQDIEKYLQSHPELRGRIPAAKTPAGDPRKPAGAAMEETTTPATTATPEKVTVAFPTIESLIREKGILPPEELKVFGQQLFFAGPTSFTPPANIPVTADYIVGPDDTIVMNVWGRLNESYTLTVQRNGSVYIPQVGSIHVAGLTFKQLVEVMRKEVESVLGVTASVTMGALRSITVFVVGAVKQPGAYTVSAFDTILSALIYSGGPEVKSLLDDWYREKLRQENIDVRQLMERLKKGTTTALTVAPKSAAKTAQFSTLMQFLSILKEERQAEDVIKRVRELDGEQMQKELESLEVVEGRNEKYANIKQLIEKIKTDKELAEQIKSYETLDIRQLEDELRKLDVIADRQERDYTLKQHVFAQERYKGVQSEKEVLLPVQFGSMRNIQLRRNDQVVSVFDLYDLLLAGDKSRDLRLQQGDVIFVPKPEATVAIFGDVKVPAVYELKKDPSLLKALEVAGGLKTSAYGGQIQVQRYANNQERVVLDTSLEAMKARKDPFILQDGDRVRVFPVVDEDVNAVYLFGNVKRPGKYQFQTGLRISEVVTENDLQPETDLSYAFVKRFKKPEMTPAIVSFKLGEAILKKTPAEDLALQPFDEIYIFRQWDFQSKPDIAVSGEVRNPGKYPLQKNMRVKDALFMAGGPNFNAYLNLAHIFRTDPKTREATMLTVDLSQALAERDRDNIVLLNKDRLVVHHIQEYRPEKLVTIEGEVRHPGQYQLTEGMTIRDLVFAAGNIKEEAYLDDAELTSMITDSGRGVKYEQKNLNLRGAFAGDAGQNVHLQSYDRLFVKRIPDWRTERFVTVQGEVKFPGRYVVKKGERLSSLLERVGGYKDTAYLRGAFFARTRVRELQQKGLQDMADRMERELLSDTGISTAFSAEEVAAKKIELEQKQKFVESLRKLKATGRMTIHLAHLRLLKGSEYDIELEDGDTLLIPQKNSVVNVAGAVMSQGSYIYSEKMTYQDYISRTGGYSRNADTDNIFVMKVDGSARKLARGLLDWSPSRNRWELANYGEEIRPIEPGDTIVVPDRVERIAWLREIRDITQILMNAAVAAGVVMMLY
ncbi:MAG: SLBB domain-containing protein [Proteobacteria bacterium]|nr:SLBB domain-containing protein [Pseudomonadota bacterium]